MCSFYKGAEPLPSVCPQQVKVTMLAYVISVLLEDAIRGHTRELRPERTKAVQVGRQTVWEFIESVHLVLLNRMSSPNLCSLIGSDHS